MKTIKRIAVSVIIVSIVDVTLTALHVDPFMRGAGCVAAGSLFWNLVDAA